MVHCHALREQVIHARPTQDADVVAEIQSTSYTEVAKAVRQLGFEVREPLDRRAPVHRFERPDGAVVDLMAPDRQTSPPRYLGRPVIPVPGSASALKRAIVHDLRDGLQIRIPDLESALALKGVAYFLPGSNRERHLQDAVTLLDCLDGKEFVASRSMRRSMNRIIRVVGEQPEAWQMCPPKDWPRAIRAARRIDDSWTAPEFILPRPPRPRFNREP